VTKILRIAHDDFVNNLTEELKERDTLSVDIEARIKELKNTTQDQAQQLNNLSKQVAEACQLETSIGEAIK